MVISYRVWNKVTKKSNNIDLHPPIFWQSVGVADFVSMEKTRWALPHNLMSLLVGLSLESIFDRCRNLTEKKVIK